MNEEQLRLVLYFFGVLFALGLIGTVVVAVIFHRRQNEFRRNAKLYPFRRR